VELAKFHIYKPGEAKLDLDSGFFYLLEARRLNEKLQSAKWQNEIESMVVIGLMERGETEKARLLFSDLISDFRKKGYKEAEAALRLKFGIWLSTNEKNYPELLQNYNQALAIYRETKNEEREDQVLLAIASIHINEGKLDLSEAELNEILKRYKAIKYQKLHYTYNLLSNISRLKGDFNKGLHYAIMCVESMENTQDTLAAPTFYGDLATIYSEVGNREKAIEYYTKSLNQWKAQGLANFAMYNTAGFIVKDLIAQKNVVEALALMQNLTNQIPPLTKLQKGCVAQTLAYCYEAMEDYKEAEKFYLESIDWYDKTGNNFETTQRAQFDVGRFYINRKQFSKAGVYLKKALSFLPQKNELTTIKDVHLMLFQVDSAEGNFLSAINHFRKHKQLNDSIFNEAKSRQIEELQIRYETEKKEKDIRLLNNRSSAQQMTLNFTFFGVGLLLIIIFLLYYQYKIKQRNNKEIGKKNNVLQQLVEEKEWLLKEIHHRVKNNLQIVISLLNTQSKYVDSEEAKDAILESSHRMQAISLIHQKLYQLENTTSVNMPTYITELAAYLETSFNAGKNLHFNLQVESIDLDVAQAIPVGLILNEAITNAIKYAFIDRTNGTISIKMQHGGNSYVMLEVHDNGIGLPDEISKNSAGTMGMRLMKGLVKQLEGKLSIENQQGVRIRVEFKTATVMKTISIEGLSIQQQTLS